MAVVGTVRATANVGQAVELDIASAVHAVKSDTVTLKQVLVPAKFETEVYGPTPDTPGSVTLVWDGDELPAIVVNLPDANDD
jgi:hypothetical protein